MARPRRDDDASLVLALAERDEREVATRALAERAGADAVIAFVQDTGRGKLVPAPGFQQTLPGGPGWRALLDACRAPGIHRGEVLDPATRSPVSAIACAARGVALVFVGGRCDERRIEAACRALAPVAAVFAAEHAAAVAAGELRVAREVARHAESLMLALDATRAELEAKARSLEEARNYAEDATRAKDEFLAMLGHELRNPLSPILTALQLLRLKGITSREHEVIGRQVAHLMRLVDDLLDVSRITQGKVHLRRERVELADVAARAVETASPLLEQHRQTLIVDVPRGLRVDGDPARLAQVFANLLTNAAKYGTPERPIRFVATPVGDRIRVVVRDEGCGIEPHMLERIFETFVQEPQAADRTRGGLGLGLAIVRSLVELHGGEVHAESAGLGCGSEFVVTLPVAAVDEPVTPDEAEVPALRRGPPAQPGTRVLVVDDNEDAAALLGDALTACGYDVAIAHDGPSALRLADELRPGVALLDLGLPVMDGLELARRLRELLNGPLRLVAITGYGQEADRERTRAAGFDAHLVKPVDLGTLQQLLADRANDEDATR